MTDLVQAIPIANLTLIIIPVMAVVGIFYKWHLKFTNPLYAIIRMLLQLLLIGYFLVYIFKSNSAWVVMIIFAVMVASSSWIALRTVEQKRAVLYKKAILSIAFGGGIVLLIVTQLPVQRSGVYGVRVKKTFQTNNKPDDPARNLKLGTQKGYFINMASTEKCNDY